MPELQTVPDLLGKAESAAAADDFASADEFLRAIARIQEVELGPLHPDLANTLNNLAIVAEKTGRTADAETFYRRAVAIASASLTADDPMLAASRQNLEEFCRAQGLPLEVPAVVQPPTRAAEPEPQAIALESASAITKVPAAPKTADSIEVRQPPSAPQPSSIPHPSPVAEPSRSFAKIAIAIVFLVIAALFVMRPWASRETAAPSSEPAPTPQASEPARPQVQEPARQAATPPAVQPAQPPAAAPPVNSTRAADKPRGANAAPVPVALVTAQLCRTLSTSGRWQCDPASDSVAPGQLAFYTRVKSPRDTIVVHRWYRGTALRRSVELEIRASANEGYRTYSRQTVDAGEEWRVEIRSASGELLHEQRVSVR